MIQRLSKSEWEPYFNYISKYIPNHNNGTKLVQIEVDSLEFGNQELINGILEGMTYDPIEDIFYVYTENLEHFIYHPLEIYIDGNIEGLNSVEVIDNDGYEHIIVMQYPLRLPELAVRSHR
jgi:hypothetical protein